jgi:hypothetical protein
VDWERDKFLAGSWGGEAGWLAERISRSMYVTWSCGLLCFDPSLSKKPADGSGASVCLRRRADPGANLRSLSELLGKMPDILLRDSEPRLCLLEEPALINLVNWPSFAEMLLRNSGCGGFSVECLSKAFRAGEGVNGGPGAGTGTR